MRADAQRNRRRLIVAAVELLLETGDEPALDAIARRAGVGIGTLYRHFPHREALLGGVAEHALDRAIAAARTALAAGHDGHHAIRQYLHAAVEDGVGALNLIHPLLDRPDWTPQRSRIAPLLTEMLERGKHDGSLRGDAQPEDVVFAVIRYSRPIEVGLPRADERAIAHRHLDLYIDGLRGDQGPLRSMPGGNCG